MSDGGQRALDALLEMVQEPLPGLEQVISITDLPPVEEQVEQLDPEMRAQAVAMFRRLADALERGDLRGARVQWREGLSHIELVELDEKAKQVRLLRRYKE
jgi:hypothetical protein